MILACAEGHDNKVVAKRLRMSQTTVCKWRARFVRERLVPAATDHRAGKPQIVCGAPPARPTVLSPPHDDRRMAFGDRIMFGVDPDAAALDAYDRFYEDAPGGTLTRITPVPRTRTASSSMAPFQPARRRPSLNRARCSAN
jgi:hypothetical protein